MLRGSNGTKGWKGAVGLAFPNCTEHNEIWYDFFDVMCGGGAFGGAVG
jgi:hypothetical protein